MAQLLKLDSGKDYFVVESAPVSPIETSTIFADPGTPHKYFRPLLYCAI